MSKSHESSTNAVAWRMYEPREADGAQRRTRLIIRDRNMKTAITVCRFCSLTPFLAAAHVAAAAFAADGQPQYLAVIRLNPDKQIEVVRLNSRDELERGRIRTLIWTDRQDERWQPLVEARASGAQGRHRSSAAPTVGFHSCRRTEQCPDTQVASLSKYLDPLTDPEVTRGASFLTPPAQGILSKSPDHDPPQTARHRTQIPCRSTDFEIGGLSATFR